MMLIVISLSQKLANISITLRGYKHGQNGVLNMKYMYARKQR